MHEITELLKAWNGGDEEALNKLIPLVDPELKVMAHNYMRNERSEHILQTTALINEALIRLIRENVSYENRGQFYGFVAKRMRQVLVDYARRMRTARRVEHVNVDDADIPYETSKEVLMLDHALTKLAEIDPRKVTIVECRFFLGLTLAETAELLGIGHATVERDWDFTRSWLKQQMTGEVKE
jgi:RNA polymerase sigma-70 factor (ECF subfamily)